MQERGERVGEAEAREIGGERRVHDDAAAEYKGASYSTAGRHLPSDHTAAVRHQRCK